MVQASFLAVLLLSAAIPDPPPCHTAPGCVAIQAACAAAGLDSTTTQEVQALGWHESRYSEAAVSRTGARGVLQVTRGQCVRWARHGRPYARQAVGCDYAAAGVWTYERFRKRSRTMRIAVCRYVAGYSPVCKAGSDAIQWRYAAAVVQTAADLQEKQADTAQNATPKGTP